jgi:phage terminase large subunit GpA-like protein
VAASTFKTETFRFLKLDRPTDEEVAAGTGYPLATIHLPSWIESEWVKQLVGEQLVTVRNKRGFARLEWQKLRERNEALDCRVYARAAAETASQGRLNARARVAMRLQWLPSCSLRNPRSCLAGVGRPVERARRHGLRF